MFIRFFKNNNPSLYFILPFVALALWVVGFMHPSTLPETNNTPLFNSIANQLVKIPYLSTIAAFLLLIAEGFIINHTVNENEFISRKSFLPALFYLVFMSNNEAMLTFHPVLVANFFIMLAINKQFSAYRKNYAFANSFDAGLCLSLATLFYFPSIILFPLLAFGLIIFRSYNWREWFVSLFGVLVPYCFVFTYYFLNNNISQPITEAKSYFVLHDRPLFDYPASFIFMLAIGLIIVLISFSKIPNSILLSSQKTKKNVIYTSWVSFFGLMSLSIAPEFTSPFLSILAVPVAMFSANYFINLKKEVVGEILFLLFIASILITDFVKYF